MTGVDERTMRGLEGSDVEKRTSRGRGDFSGEDRLFNVGDDCNGFELGKDGWEVVLWAEEEPMVPLVVVCRRSVLIKVKLLMSEAHLHF